MVLKSDLLIGRTANDQPIPQMSLTGLGCGGVRAWLLEQSGAAQFISFGAIMPGSTTK
jgi:hypothetical protein